MKSTASPIVSVIVPTHNPHSDRLRRTLEGLRTQTFPAAQWEILLIDNASEPPLDKSILAPLDPLDCRIVREPLIGLSHARRRGFSEAKGNLAVLVDDDNVIATDYLATTVSLFSKHPWVGLLGGRSIPEFEIEPEAWKREFDPLLALRDLGSKEMLSQGLLSISSGRKEYPTFAPIGAGMALRRAAWEAWIENHRTQSGSISDRRGRDLTSGGDNDIVLSAMRAGWEVGYFPSLSLTHIIPQNRLEPEYLARLNRGIQRSWMQVLSLHDANPWPPLDTIAATLRQLKAWFSYRVWTSPAARIRWQGACGHFEGRVKP